MRHHHTLPSWPAPLSWPEEETEYPEYNSGQADAEPDSDGDLI